MGSLGPCLPPAAPSKSLLPELSSAPKPRERATLRRSGRRDMTRYILCAAILLAALTHPLPAMTPQERQQYLEKLIQILPDVPSFKQWLEKTGELPPDFHAFPKTNGLPDPLKFLDGRPVRTPSEWKARRTEIRQLLEKY